MDLHTVDHRRTFRGAPIALGLAVVLTTALGVVGPAQVHAARVTHRAVRCADTATGTRGGACAATFALPDTQGRRVALAHYRGHPVLLNFCGPGCPYCAQELPDLQAFAATFLRRGGVILGVDMGGSARDVLASYARDNRVAWPLLVDPPTRVGNLYGVSGTPTNVFVDRRGVIRAVEDNPLQLEDFRQLSKGL
jgi:peroxiredoxin